MSKGLMRFSHDVHLHRSIIRMIGRNVVLVKTQCVHCMHGIAIVRMSTLMHISPVSLSVVGYFMSCLQDNQTTLILKMLLMGNLNL